MTPSKTLSDLDEVITQARDILLAAPELNMANYSWEQVRDLNNAAIETYLLLDEAITAWNDRANTRSPIPGTVDIRSTYRDTMKRFPKTMELLATTNPMTDRGTEIERVKNALSPLVNEEMDAEMRDAWLTDLATAAISAMSSEDEGWQPIETAPNDWRMFLAWCPSVGLVMMTRHDNESRTYSLTGRVKNPEPTHWMPLPKPPRTALTPNPCGQEES